MGSRERVVIRDAGGIGDIVRMFPILDALASAGPVTFCTNRVYEALMELCPSVASGAVSLRLWAMDGHRAPLAPAKHWGDLKGVPYATGPWGLQTPVIDLLCPALVHEVATAGRPVMDRLECWARAAGIPTPPTGSVRLAIPAAAAAEGRRWAASLPHPLVAISPSSNASIRTWRNGEWRGSRTGMVGALIQELRLRGFNPVIFESQRIGSDCPQSISSDIRVQAARVAACDGFIGPDSGMLHIAAALQIPAVGIFGATDGRLVMRPYNGPLEVVQGVHDGIVAATFGCTHPCYGMMVGGYNPRKCSGRCGVLERVMEPTIVAALDRLLKHRRSLKIASRPAPHLA